MWNCDKQNLGKLHLTRSLEAIAILLAIILVFPVLIQAQQKLPYKPYKVLGGGGIEIAVQEWGNPAGPAILFIHGFSQSHMAWVNQYESELATTFRIITMDIRGHGASDKPLAIENYTDSQLWADDIAAVIKTLDLRDPVLVGWSYGGMVILDYIRYFGDQNIGGINFVGAAVDIAVEGGNTQAGEGCSTLGAMCSPELKTNIDGTITFLNHCFAKPIDQHSYNTVLAYNMVVPNEVRKGLLSRVVNNEDLFSRIKVPVLITHGKADLVILPTTAENIQGKIENVEISFYDGVGHSPFTESTGRFNNELAEFTQKVQ
jgi:pimeloyl-ACP methyl ester carboxylesterase